MRGRWVWSDLVGGGEEWEERKRKKKGAEEATMRADGQEKQQVCGVHFWEGSQAGS